MNRKHLTHFVLLLSSYLLLGYCMSTGIIYSSYFKTLMVNLNVLIDCNFFLKRDFEIVPFHHSDSMLKHFFGGMFYALIFSGTIWCVCTLFEETTFIVVGRYFGFWNLCLWLIAQIIIAFAEEILFRIYFHEILCRFLKKKGLSEFLISLVFAAGHLAGRSWNQLIVPFAFSLSPST